MWFVHLNLIDPTGDEELPPVENWRALPVREYEYDAEPALSLAATYDPDPTYVRMPLWYGGTDTEPAYGHQPNHTDLTTLVFEVPSNALELLYGDPVEATWSFFIRS